MNLYRNAMIELVEMLNEAGIYYQISLAYDGWQIRFNKDRDVVCHSWSYGSASGLWEEYYNGEVIGNLTAEEVTRRVLG